MFKVTVLVHPPFMCHSDFLFNIAPDSMALLVTDVQSLFKKQWCTGRQMVLSAVRHGVAEKFV